jgi:hypothetical protein
VREICTLRSVGAGARATAPGHPVAISDDRPYRDLTINSFSYTSRQDPATAASEE